MSNRFTAPWSVDYATAMQCAYLRFSYPNLFPHGRGRESREVSRSLYVSPLRYDTARCPQTPRHTLLFPSMCGSSGTRTRHSIACTSPSSPTIPTVALILTPENCRWPLITFDFPSYYFSITLYRTVGSSLWRTPGIYWQCEVMFPSSSCQSRALRVNVKIFLATARVFSHSGLFVDV